MNLLKQNHVKLVKYLLLQEYIRRIKQI